MGSGPGSPFGPGDKAPEPPGCLALEDSPHPHKQKLPCLDTTQTTCFFNWWLLLFFQEILEVKGDLKKSQA